MFQIELLIVISLAVGATFFVVVVSVGLIINKWVELRQTKGIQRLYNFYSTMMADLLLQQLPETLPGSSSPSLAKTYEAVLAPVKSGLSWSTTARKHQHRVAIRNVLIDFAKDLTGESQDRLEYFFDSLGFVDEEIENLAGSHWWNRAQSAYNLGLYRSVRGIPALTRALEDSHEDVRSQAMQSLVVLSGVDALKAIFGRIRNMSRWTTLELSVIVRQYEDRSIPYLIESLQYSDQSVVLFSIEMLAEIGFVAAVEPLVDMAQSYPNVLVRSKAIEALGRLGDERAEPVLRNFLTNPYPSIRSSAVRALERVGSPGSIKELLEHVQSGDVSDRISAARALAKSGTTGLEELRRLTENSDQLVKGVALHVLEEAEGMGEEA